MRYYHDDNTTMRILGPNAEQLLKDPKTDLGQRSELVFLINPSEDGQCEIAMRKDGVPAAAWRGALTDLSTNIRENATPPKNFGRAFRITCDDSVTFHAIELRLHGE